ncbi:MAG: copper-binding protein [Beijerinckiaceae bacterium]|nr:MAG: copper-binding protein [Beijerinckiaceae bacterium]
MNIKHITAIAAAASFFFFAISATVWAASATENGEVKKVDVAASKITIKQGPIKALDMKDSMTMVYRVKDPAMLKSVKVGDKVQFELDQDSNGYTVTKIKK